MVVIGIWAVKRGHCNPSTGMTGMGRELATPPGVEEWRGGGVEGRRSGGVEEWRSGEPGGSVQLPYVVLGEGQ